MARSFRSTPKKVCQDPKAQAQEMTIDPGGVTESLKGRIETHGNERDVIPVAPNSLVFQSTKFNHRLCR